MKQLLAILTTLALLLCMAACGETTPSAETITADETTTELPTEASPAYADALEILNTIWDGIDENNKFAAFGGNQTENAVQDAPGAFDLTDVDGLTRLLLVPEDLQGSVSDAASLVHLMNSNNFTGAVLKMDAVDEEVTMALVEKITTNHFMCGFPEKVVVMTLGDYVIYAFGTESLINSFRDAATANLTGEIAVAYDDWMA